LAKEPELRDLGGKVPILRLEKGKKNAVRRKPAGKTILEHGKEGPIAERPRRGGTFVAQDSVFRPMMSPKGSGPEIKKRRPSPAEQDPL